MFVPLCDRILHPYVIATLNIACKGVDAAGASHFILECNCYQVRKSSAEIERNDSGVGSETSKSSRSRWQHCGPATNMREDQQLLCEDCDQPVETQVRDAIGTRLIAGRLMSLTASQWAWPYSVTAVKRFGERRTDPRTVHCTVVS